MGADRLEEGTVAPTERTTSPMSEYEGSHVRTGAVVFVIGTVLAVGIPLGWLVL